MIKAKRGYGYLCLIVMSILVSCQEKTYDEQAIPDEYRFSQEVFFNYLNEPVELEVMPDGNILYIERKGGIRLYDPVKYEMVLQDSLPVFYGFEDGLMGMALDPDFEETKWIYLYYSPVGTESKQHLSRFTLTDQGIKDEKVILIVPTQRDECCHTGGSIEFGPGKLLYVSTGDDTNPFESDGYAPIDDREGRESFDARGTSSNTNDLRGKILRIKPETDGTYTIPKGNLFEDDDPLTRPEIYVMGCRNPYRITVDQKRNWLFWGDVGPDAGDNHDVKGPKGHDEMNVAMTPGYYGWPLFIANNQAYGDYDFDLKEAEGFFDPLNPVNDSKNNTGIQNLPPAREAMIYYPYVNSEVFPQLKNGGRTAMTGPVYYGDAKNKNENRFPSYFDGRLLVYDWMRDWIFTVMVDESGKASDFEPFMPSQKFYNIIDMDFGPDGTLYMIEYGTAWFSANQDARLSRINFNRENRVPKMEVKLSANTGSAPLTVTLDASGSVDFDGDALTYEWKIGGEYIEGDIVEYTFEEDGIYWPRLTLEDAAGHTLMQQFKVEVGNDAPVVTVNIKGNNTFYWAGRNIEYEVSVNDKQDGSIGNGITREVVEFEILYTEGMDQAQILGHQMPVTTGESLIQKSDCMSCHKLDGKSVGPSFVEVATRYENQTNALDELAAKVIKGGSGAWGDHSMSAHPDFTPDEAKSMITYIMSLTEEVEETKSLKGVYTVSEVKKGKEVILSARYKDKGAGELSSIMDMEIKKLVHNVVEAGSYNISENITTDRRKKMINRINSGGWCIYSGIDLTDVKSIDLKLLKTSELPVEISLYLDGPEGELIGQLLLNGPNDPGQIETIELKSTSGEHDIYFVFNSEDKEKNLLQINTLTFNIDE
ncbi:MAG: PQQ-dependent sugar dehydrogenase [Reichenbachiella sp.]